jgi:8-amino-7-oxononanoate synthase
MDPLAKLRAELLALKSRGLLRVRSDGVAVPTDEPLVDVCSNDYLGYACKSVSRETTEPGGAGASRLIRATKKVHSELESLAADWVGLEDSLVFSSGYAANVGTLAAIAGPEDFIISDRLNHASIIDGCRLGGATVHVVPHGNADAVVAALKEGAGARTRWVVTESYFSMDGDSPDLPRLRTLCDAHDAGLYVDEAHALGVFGPEGGGLCREAGIEPDVLVGTLGKAVGVQGAFVAGRRELLDFLWNRARSFVFSTAVSPLLAQIAAEHVRRIRADDDARTRLRSACARLAETLDSNLPGPIFPVVLGTPERALAAVELLRQKGFAAVAIRPPTVPDGASRVRISLNTKLTEADLVRLGTTLRQCLAS